MMSGLIRKDIVSSPADERDEPPSAPPGWERLPLVRLRDPDGGALAWVSPGHGGNTIGFSVCLGGRWRQVLFLEGPEALRSRPTRYGCPVLFPFPGHAPDARYQFQGVMRTLPVNGPDGRSHVHGFAHDRPWRLDGEGDDRVSLSITTPRDLTPVERAAYPFDIAVRQIVTLSNMALTIRLEATNLGEKTAPVGLGLHPYLDPAFFDSARRNLRLSLPGTLQRILAGPVPTGELQSAPPRTLLPDRPDGLLTCITGLGNAVTASMWGTSVHRLQCELVEGWSDLVVYAPPDQPSVALEPLTCALSAASLDAGPAGSIPALEPGRSITAVMRLVIRHEETDDETSLELRS